MPVKYQCPKCERRFVEWGAQKLNFKCPTCPNVELVKMGGAEGQLVQPPRLKRRPQRIGKTNLENELSMVDMEGMEEEETFDEGGITELDFGLDHVPIAEDAEPLESEIRAEDETASEEVIAVESETEALPDVSEDLAFDDEAALDLNGSPEEFEEES
ncbi:MAG TPA: hypothetical protein PLI09_18135 [Candidatus Hydrogenedentes bacterium]|nr:hypothetical protein [Candidatus Hydrogenedentota bacterium]